MAEIRAILIDDEQSAINVLTNLLERSSTEVEVINSCNSLEEGVAEIKKLKPNVVFLDIQMPNYAGYEIVKFFDKIDFEIIFVTAYDQYAVKAFELNAIDYLVKPINRNKLALTLDRLEKKINEQEKLIDYQNLLETIQNRNYKKIVIPEVGNRRIINLEDIIAIEASASYAKIYSIENTIITASKNLKYFEDILSKETNFYRSHRAWIVNLKHIEVLNKTTQTIILANSTVNAKITRAKIEDFEAIFK